MIAMIGGINVLRWVGECGESCPLNQPGAREDLWQVPPGGDAVPPTAMPGVWQVGGCDSRGLLRAGHGVRQAVSC